MFHNIVPQFRSNKGKHPLTIVEGVRKSEVRIAWKSEVSVKDSKT